jgi:hypothetical protein
LQIDSLQKFDGMSDTAFDAGELLAERKVEIAKQAAWTSRDEHFAEALTGYLDLTKMEHDEIELLQKTDAYRMDDARMKLDMQGTEVRAMLKVLLHEGLN